ncbi:MAG TPA: cardiolipin synthase [Gemmatimonadales bacterium]|nr:cardiolipin synthase [Gemmatimonadales bacterium]
MWILVAAVATAVVVLLLLNLSGGRTRIEHEIPPLYGVGDEQFVRTMGVLLGPAMVGGNEVTSLQNGDEIFPAMLEAIRSAEETITFETYIYWSGRIGKEFADALSERARAGVKVHVLLDWLGSGKMDAELLRMMEDAGVEVLKYHPLRWHSLDRVNNRTHRKLLVVDGRVGFTGGVGIADEWLGHAEDSLHWRDSHYRVTGPAVAQMQAAFMDNWITSRSLVLHGREYFPQIDTAGPHLAQVFKSSSDDGSESVRLMYLLSIASARKNLRLSASYFVPDSLSIASLVAAENRGVDVQIVVPGRHIDAAMVRRASRASWGPLLEAGVRIYEFQPTMYHCKVMIVDDRWVSVGSTNFDNRSFKLNDEANLNVLDPEFAAEQARVFEADLARSTEITLEAWRNRPWQEKLGERLASLLRAQL